MVFAVSQTSIYKLAHLCVASDCVRDRKWVMPTFLILGSISFEVASLRIMGVLSNIYRSVSTQDLPMFFNTLVTACIVVALISSLKSFVAFASDTCALQWRSCIVDYFQCGYTMNGFNEDNRTSRVDTVDQRITQDTDRLTAQCAKLFATTAVLPGVILFYAVYLAVLFGPAVPLLCVLYFVVGSAVSYLMAKGIVGTVYRQEQLEGAFRATHYRVQLYKNEIFLLGGECAEYQLMSKDYDRLMGNTQVLIRYRFWLNMFTNWFAYTGSIVNYIVVGGAIFYMYGRAGSSASPDSEADLASKLAEGSYACLYLISALSTLISSSESASEAAGLARRVSELLDLLPPDCEQNTATECDVDPCQGHTSMMQSNGKGRAPGHQYGRIAQRDTAESISAIEMSSAGTGFGVQQASGGGDSALLLSIRALDVYAESCSGCTGTGTGTAGVDAGSAPGRGRLLVRGLSLQVSEGMRVLVTGPSGCGKSTLLRAIARAVRDQVGGYIGGMGIAVSVPANTVIICPQTPYLFKGTLRENLLYPRLLGDRLGGNLIGEGADIDAGAIRDTESLLGGTGSHNASSSCSSSTGAQDSVADLHRVLGAVGLEAFRAFLPPMDTHTAAGTAHIGGGRKPAPSTHQRTSREVSLTSGLLPQRLTSADDGRNTRMRASYEHDTPTSTSSSAGEEVRDWAGTVSQGEKQRIAVARALLHTPQLALFDEISSALDEETEHSLYCAITASCRTFVSFGHRSTLRQHHTHELQLRSDGSYTFGPHTTLTGTATG